MKRLLLFASILALPLLALCQDFPRNEITAEELNMKQYDKDTSAHAVVLQEYGTSSMSRAGDNYIKLFHQYHVKIKIFDSRAFNKGTVQITLGANDDVAESVYDIKGHTEYIDDDGTIKKFDLEPDKIYRNKESKYRETVKFALPGLKKGCVIEYSYTLETPFYHDFKPWIFQSNIPKVYSEYDVHIPGFWNYNIVIKGGLKLSKQTAALEDNCFSSHGASSGCSHFVYGMKDIPALIPEEYMTAPKNFLSAIYFELSDYTDLNTGAKKKQSVEWADVDHTLKENDQFGGQIKRTSYMKARIAPLIAAKASEIDKAKAVFEYIQKNIKWNHVNTHQSKSIADALEKHTGNVGDINLALVTALNAAGINTEAVLVSTRDNGVVNKLYPTVDDFNYVIAKANIGGKSYFLDATEPLIGFGVLPLRCFNGDGRAVSTDKPSYWVPVENGQRENITSTFDLTLQPDGKIKGTYIEYSTDYAAFLKREAIKKFNSTEEYIDRRDEQMNRIKFTNAKIENLDSLDMPVVETYEIEFETARNMNAGTLGFSPYIVGKTTVNPFKLAERSYPVNMGVPVEMRYIITMHLPENYTVETSIQPEAIALPNQGGKYVCAFEQHGNFFSYSHVLQFTKSVYWPDEYAALKEFYNKIILSERQNITFRKSKS